MESNLHTTAIISFFCENKTLVTFKKSSSVNIHLFTLSNSPNNIRKIILQTVDLFTELYFLILDSFYCEKLPEDVIIKELKLF